MRLRVPTPIVWACILLAAGCASNSFLTCGGALVAFAVVGVATLGFRRGSLVALGIWLESQILGFAVLGYPHTSMTFAWGAVLGLGTLAAAAIANASASRGRIIGFALAFGGYELLIAAFAKMSASGLSAFTPAILGQLFASNAGVALGATALFFLVGSAEPGVVRTFGRARYS